METARTRSIAAAGGLLLPAVTLAIAADGTAAGLAGASRARSRDDSRPL